MYDINVFENIRYNIDKTMMKDGEFYSAVITYLNGKKDDHSAQTLLWELSHSKENGYFFTDLDFAEFKSTLDNMKISGGGVLQSKKLKIGAGVLVENW